VVYLDRDGDFKMERKTRDGQVDQRLIGSVVVLDAEALIKKRKHYEWLTGERKTENITTHICESITQDGR
jgi:hypothetical protein